MLQWALYNTLCNRLLEAFPVSFISLVPFSALQNYVLIGFAGIGVLVGAFGGVNAIRNYLKV